MSLSRKNKLKIHAHKNIKSSLSPPLKDLKKENIYLINQRHEDDVELLLNFTTLTSDQTEQQPAMSTLMLPRKNGHLTKRPFALQNIRGFDSQV